MLPPRCSVMVSNFLAISFKRTLGQEDTLKLHKRVYLFYTPFVFAWFSWAELPPKR